MKLFASLLLVALSALVGPSHADPADLIDVTVTSAQLNEPTNVFLKTYGINSVQAIPLPLSKDSLNGSTYVEYSTAVQNHTSTPEWGNTVGFSNYFFTTQSYVAFELWSQTYDSSEDVTYLGGAQFTIAQIQELQQSSTVVVTAPSGLSPGYLTLSWTNGQ